MSKQSFKRRKTSVITTKNASVELGLNLSIDKIEFKFDEYLSKEKLLRILETNKVNYTEERLKSEHSIKVDSFYFIYLKNTKLISRITTNPNRFSSFQDYKEKTEKLLKLFSNPKPSRLDVALDIHQKNFEWINSRLLIPRKRKINRYVLNGSEEQSRYHGEHPKITMLYEKKDKEEESEFVRVESRIFTKSLLESDSLDELIINLSTFKLSPFKGVKLIDYKFKKIPYEKKYIPLLLLIERAKTLLRFNGFFYTRKVFNKHKNVNRVFKRIFNDENRICLDACYKELLPKYLEIEEDV
jgi:hypothetical protein